MRFGANPVSGATSGGDGSMIVIGTESELLSVSDSGELVLISAVFVSVCGAAELLTSVVIV